MKIIMPILAAILLMSCGQVHDVRQARQHLEREHAEIYRCAEELYGMSEADTISREELFELSANILFTIEQDSVSIILDELLGE